MTSGVGGGGEGGACTADLASIQTTLFLSRCSNSGCHNATDLAGDLDLVTAGLDERLIDVKAATCTGLRVQPGSPDASILYRKVNETKPECGDRMPIGGALSATELTCIHDWIASLPSGCETCGGAACVDRMTDNANCSACGNACPQGTSCEAGQCTCSAGGILCSGVCTATNSDPKNCGGCGASCTGNEVCLKGGCTSAGCGTLTQCGGACIDTKLDLMNCGGCGKACAASETCEASVCVCPGAGNLMTDPKNCGACGNACALGETCTMGKCACGTATVAFAAAVEPILTAKCATSGCHIGVAPKEGLDLSKGKAYAALVNVKATECKDGRFRVEPGAPGTSYLMDKVMNVDLCSGTKMPKSTDLAAADVQTLINWICEGAPNN